MGIDIYYCIERRGSDGHWERAEPLDPAPESPSRRRAWPVCIKRNYTLYDALAFGVMVGEGSSWPYYLVEPIAPPRGLPEDATGETRIEFGAAPDAYNASWLLIREIETFDWDQDVVYTNRRLMTKDRALEAKWVPIGNPFPNAHGAPLQDYVWRPGYSYREAARDFLEGNLPELKALGNPGEVRLVFWFG